MAAAALVKQRWKKRIDAPDAHRLRGRAGMQRRDRWLSAHPLCCMCEAKTPPRWMAATVVDHVVPLSQGGADDEANLQSLCDECHDAKTRLERGQRERVTVGLDGWPVGKW